MKADLSQREPVWLQRWQDERQYDRILDARRKASAPRFVLHDGPPYPTGGIHYGTVLNKVLKDIVVRSRLMMGYEAPFRPGWDCHGLPIEQQVEKELGAKKAGLGAAEFRRLCEAHALKFVDLMRGEFKRLGCLGSWDEPYLTLLKDYEATIVRQLAGFARVGLLYRDKKPVHWCPIHRTALAEAEVEYQDHASPSIYVRFPIEDGLGAADETLAGKPAAFVIWTTTPWTLPANLAIVANPELEYVAIPAPRDGGEEYLVVARGLAETFLKATGLDVPAERWVALSKDGLRRLEGVRYRHPLQVAPRAEKDFRLWFARHATLEAGTGLVHTAPGHGLEDYVVGREHGLQIYAPVDEQGRFTSDVEGWAGTPVFEANQRIVTALVERGALLNKPGELVHHSYPHCWRCKNAVIFRATNQWFARLGTADEPSSLRRKALDEIGKTQWIPSWGENRIRGMIEARPDWCLSRQRVWGVPIPAFRCANGHVTADAGVMEHIAEIFQREGSSAWFTKSAREMLPAGATCPECGSSELEKESDIVDVWFESGVSWAAVAEGKLVPDHQKVDLYLEGSDQHRGWFHSALLTSAATRGQAPYKAVLTHGWVLDERGKVYSKSEIAKARASGLKIDYIEPAVWMQKNGAELLRLWTAASDYQGDIVFSKTVLNQLSESYRKIRNTCRFLLSNLSDFVPSRDALDDQHLREMDLLAAGLLRERDNQIWDAYRRYAFHEVIRGMVEYVNTTSAEILDAAKDALYCERADSPVRRSVQTLLYEMTRTLASWMAPVLCFTAQDVADELSRTTREPFDVHAFVRRPSVPEGTDAGRQNQRWTEQIRPRREAVLKALESFRAAGHKSLEAKVIVRPAASERAGWQFNLAHLTELCVVSIMELTPEDAQGETEIQVVESPHAECPRCWRRTGERSGDARDPNLCPRCAAAVAT